MVAHFTPDTNLGTDISAKALAPREFAKDFLWGVSTAAHQVEGNSQNQWSDWEAAGHIRSGDSCRSACDWWNNAERDFDLVRDMGLNALESYIKRTQAVASDSEYKGISSRWCSEPGCFERYLQRKEGNCLFPANERWPRDEAIGKARARDREEYVNLDRTVKALLDQTKIELDQKRVMSLGWVMDFQKKTIEPFMTRAAGMGKSGIRIIAALDHIWEASSAELERGAPARIQNEMRELLADTRKFMKSERNVFFAQTLRSDTPITADDYFPALLCESTETIKGVVEFLRTHNSTAFEHAHEIGISLIDTAARQGFELPHSEEKLELLRATIS